MTRKKVLAAGVLVFALVVGLQLLVLAGPLPACGVYQFGRVLTLGSLALGVVAGVALIVAGSSNEPGRMSPPRKMGIALLLLAPTCIVFHVQGVYVRLWYHPQPLPWFALSVVLLHVVALVGVPVFGALSGARLGPALATFAVAALLVGEDYRASTYTMDDIHMADHACRGDDGNVSNAGSAGSTFSSKRKAIQDFGNNRKGEE